MGTTSLPRIPHNADQQTLINSLNFILEELDHLLNGNVDSKNAREIGGWRVGLQQMESKDKDVGMSTDDEGPDPIRFWAGDVVTGQPAFYVTKSGKIFASKGEFAGKITAKSGTIGGFTIDETKLSGAGIIEGGTIRTATENDNRFEITGAGFKGYTSDNLLQGLVLSPTDLNFFDIFLYHRNVKYAEFYDGGTHYTLRPTVSTGMGIGGSAGPINAVGNWDFTGSAIIGTIPGNCASANYAASSGTATEVPSTGIEPGTYTKAAFAADGRATAGSSLIESDIPALDFSTKISGKPTTAAGYGITDAWTTGDAPNNHATNGYQKLPSGLIFNWGQTPDVSVPANGSANQTFTFPEGFPNQAFQVVATNDASGASANGGSCQVYSLSQSNVSVILINNTNSPQTMRARVFAIGK